jgi:Tol biopolymer transport system component
MDASVVTRRYAMTRRLAWVALALAACGDDPITPPVEVQQHPLPAQPIPNPQIAFVSDRDGLEYVYVASADGSFVGRLTPGWSPAWSWDGQKIAYVAGGASGRAVWVMDADGSNRTQLTADGEFPGWSPDGRIVFSRRGADPGIFTMSGAGGDLTKIIDADFPVDPDDSQEGYQTDLLDPTWSPDGQTIAFLRFAAGSLQLYLANADGTGLRRLAEGPRLLSPAFSPDGSTLAFEYLFVPSLTDLEGFAIVTSSLDAAEPSQLEPRWGPGLHVAQSPDWSHNGTHLVFSQPTRVASASDRNPTRARIYLVSLLESRWQQLVPDAAAAANPGYDDIMPAWARVAR